MHDSTTEPVAPFPIVEGDPICLATLDALLDSPAAAGYYLGLRLLRRTSLKFARILADPVQARAWGVAHLVRRRFRHRYRRPLVVRLRRR